MPNVVSDVELRRLLWVGPLTVIAATIGVLIVRTIGVAIVNLSPSFPHLGWLPPTLDETAGETRLRLKSAGSALAALVLSRSMP